jgi:cytochrome c-type biogenesis protein CcmH
MNHWFWFIAGVLSGVTASAVALPLWRTSGRLVARQPMRYMLAAGIVVSFVISAALLYLALGSPRTLEKSVAATPAAHPAAASAAAGSKTLSMEAATARLEARLSREGGTPDDWRLLAQSYDFLGRTDDAQRARARAESAAPAAKASTAGTSARGISGGAPELSVEDLQRQVRANPRDSRSWLALADAQRRQHDNAAARDAYRKVISLNGMNAQAWADYADVVAGLEGGSLGGEAAQAVESSLRLDPANAKALWLKASRLYQERRDVDALATWRSLKQVLPPDSADVALVDANIAEAAQLAGLPAQQSLEAAQGSARVEVSGTVSVESRLASRVGRGSTLFIYAKAVDSPGPPLAVLRTTTGDWPVSFRLDDSMAMVPSRRLSQFQKVVVEARISRSGQATPAPGDLYVTSEALTPGAGRKLALIINREIG